MSRTISWARVLIAAYLTAAAAFVAAQDKSAPAREPRIALVIGNAAYSNDPLKNPVNDAADISAALEKLGFRVTKLTNATLRQTVEAITRFGQELRKGGVGLFYFAGHGVQSKGRNYLMPIGANVNTEDQLEFEAVDAYRVLATMDAAGNRVNIVILDACRDNPYARGFRSGTRGLAQMDAAKGSLIAFATGPGQVASDGVGRNGLYTQFLLRSLEHPDSDIDKVFRRVTAEVTRASGNRQVPWKSDSLTGEFYFRADAAPPQATAPEPAAKPLQQGAAPRQQTQAATPPADSTALASRPVVTLVPPSQTPAAAKSAKPNTSLHTEKSATRDCDVCPVMINIPAGAFVMGSDADGTERPARPVKISRPYAIGRHEVTFDEWDACVRERGCTHNPRDQNWGRGTRPVINVSWTDARLYTQWLSKKTGKRYRLPSEAEWEYAARAGTATAFSTGPNINPAQAQYDVTRAFAGSNTLSETRTQTAAVGSFPPNAFGLHDVHGNVWEWTEDCWNRNHEGAQTGGEVRTTGDCNSRVTRGGGWNDQPRYIRSSHRSYQAVDSRLNNVGFRVVRAD